MPTRTEKSKPKESPEEHPAPTPTFGILFQLEDIAVNGRKVAFEVLKSVLKDQKVELPAFLFSRYCLYSAPQVYLPDLLETLGSRKSPVNKLIEEASDKINARLSSNSIELAAGLNKILQEARERNLAAATITALPETTAQAILAKTGLERVGVRLFAYPDTDKVFPGGNIWLKTARALTLKPHNCAVLTGNVTACKSALSADMRCVAIPDEFTSFQDYGGAFMMLEALDEIGPRELLDALFPAPGKRGAG